MRQSKEMELVKTIDLNGDKKLSNLSQLLFLVMAALGVGAIFLFGVHGNSDVPAVFVVLFCAAYILVHELTHVAFMRLFSKQKILFSIKLPTVAVGSLFYFNRRQFVIVALAPFVCFMAIISALFVILPQNFDFLLTVLMTLNFAGSSGDMLQVAVVSGIKGDIYMQDDGKSTKVYGKTKEI